MGNIIHKSEDAIAITLLVLQKAAERLKLIIFKFILKDHFPDLRGVVSKEESSKSSDQLITEIKDPFIALLHLMFETIRFSMLKIGEPDVGDQTTVVFSTAARQRANDLFLELVYPNFISDNKRDAEDGYDDMEYLEYLDVFIYDLIVVVEQLLMIQDSAAGNSTKYAVAKEVLWDLRLALQKYQDKVHDKNYRV